MGLGSLAELTSLQPEAESPRVSSSVEARLTWCLSSPPVTRSTWGHDIIHSVRSAHTLTLSAADTKLLHPWPYLPTFREARSPTQPS